MVLLRVLAFAGLAALAGSDLAAAQGLGDAASKEKKRRGSSPTSKAKTYTQEDLSTLPSTPNEAADSDTDAATEPAANEAPGRGERVDLRPATPADEGAARARNEEAWRARVAAARARVDEARRVHETLAAMNLVPGYQYVDSKGAPVVQSVEELQRLTAAAKGRVEAAEKALDDLLEEARRAGVPPGWLR